VLCTGTSLNEPLLFADSFDSPTLASDWAVFSDSATVKDGALHVRDRDGWPRDASAGVHDGDACWKDYTVSVKAGFAAGSEWDYFNLLMRVNGYRRSSGGSFGDGYELEGVGTTGWSEVADRNVFHLRRQRNGIAVELARVPFVFPAQPVEIAATLIGGHITVHVDDTLLIDVIDSAPLQYGGVGVHSIWESEAVFDDLLVTANVL